MCQQTTWWNSQKINGNFGNGNGIAPLHNSLVTALHLSTLEEQTTAPTVSSQSIIVPSFYSEAEKGETQTN